jgi:hypothetical protein
MISSWARWDPVGGERSPVRGQRVRAGRPKSASEESGPAAPPDLGHRSEPCQVTMRCPTDASSGYGRCGAQAPVAS